MLLLLLCLLALALMLLAFARRLSDYPENIAINLGADLIGAIVTIFVIGPLINRADDGRVREHPRLDYLWYVDRVAGARSVVRVLDTFSNILDGPHTPRFFQAAERALHRDAAVQILLLDPDSQAAAQRAQELGDAELRREIMRNLRALWDFRAHVLPERLRENFDVRVYSASPSIALYRWDEKALVSFFPLGRLSGQGTQLEVTVGSPLGEFVNERFNEIWAAGRDIDDFMMMPVTVHSSQPVREFELEYVELDSVLYVADGRIVAEMARHRNEPLVAHCQRGRAVLTELTMVDDGDAKLMAALTERFQEKYGHRGDVFVCLQPITDRVQENGKRLERW
ncbi:hypothetical protein [Lentzea sp. NBRC 105346]|uniref:hypothetical protein n=1 Tax=Lentzea sp. NBRC 105346 TaxID=3032205 RepID=UPI00255220B5|nr:hypothetical protein [Lentzea sp. NBRC 105346]